jgi:hypothetical protein
MWRPVSCCGTGKSARGVASQIREWYPAFGCHEFGRRARGEDVTDLEQWARDGFGMRVDFCVAALSGGERVGFVGCAGVKGASILGPVA